jgi:hypothetical protein
MTNPFKKKMASSFDLKYFFGQLLHFSLSAHKECMHLKSIVNSSIAMISLKTLYPGEIRTRVLCSGGDVHCATQFNLGTIVS